MAIDLRCPHCLDEFSVRWPRRYEDTSDDTDRIELAFSAECPQCEKEFNVYMDFSLTTTTCLNDGRTLFRDAESGCWEDAEHGRL